MKSSPDYDTVQSKGWRWVGMGYRPNGDGYGQFKHDATGRKWRIGAAEAGWDTRKEMYKVACFRAMLIRLLKED